MTPALDTSHITQDEFSAYAAPVLLQLAGMARRAKKEFAGYLLEMAASDLMIDADPAEMAELFGKRKAKNR